MTDHNEKIKMEKLNQFRQWQDQARLCGKVAFKTQLDKCSKSLLRHGAGLLNFAREIFS